MVAVLAGAAAVGLPLRHARTKRAARSWRASFPRHSRRDNVTPALFHPVGCFKVCLVPEIRRRFDRSRVFGVGYIFFWSAFSSWVSGYVARRGHLEVGDLVEREDGVESPFGVLMRKNSAPSTLLRRKPGAHLAGSRQSRRSRIRYSSRCAHRIRWREYRRTWSARGRSSPARRERVPPSPRCPAAMVHIEVVDLDVLDGMVDQPAIIPAPPSRAAEL